MPCWSVFSSCAFASLSAFAPSLVCFYEGVTCSSVFSSCAQKGALVRLPSVSTEYAACFYEGVTCSSVFSWTIPTRLGETPPR